MTTEKQLTTEEALELFRINFPLTQGVNVDEDFMSYNFRNYASINAWVMVSNNIIKSFDLPLRVKTWSGEPGKGVLIIESNLK